MAKRRGTRRIFKMFRDKAQATTGPVAAVSQLKGLWDREFSVYRPIVAKVTGRKGSLLSFEMVINSDGRTDKVPHTVDLDDGSTVWGDLPSTAQLVEPDSEALFGYLLLNQNWLYENVAEGYGKLEGGGTGDPPKIPRIASL